MVVGVGKPRRSSRPRRSPSGSGSRSTDRPNPWRRRLIWTVVVVVALGIGLLLTPGFPERLVVNVAKVFDSFQEWVIANQATSPLFIYFLNPIKDAANALLDATTNVLNRMTYVGVIVGAAALAGVLAGWRLAIVAAVGFSVMGLLGLWESSMETLALIFVSVGTALLIGIPLGIWTGRNDRAETIMRPVLDAMQTVPAFAYLLPLVLLFGIGAATAIISTLIFALPPAVRLTSLGIRGVPPTALEVSGSFGSTRRQMLRKVQLPMAKPSIMLGVNQTIMMAMGMVVIAAIVAAPAWVVTSSTACGSSTSVRRSTPASRSSRWRSCSTGQLRVEPPRPPAQADDRAARPFVHPASGGDHRRRRHGRRRCSSAGRY